MTNVYDIFYEGEAPFLALGKNIWENCSFENVNKKMDTGNFLGNLLDCCSRQNNTPISYKKIYEAFLLVHLLNYLSGSRISSLYFRTYWRRISFTSNESQWIDKVFDARNKKWYFDKAHEMEPMYWKIHPQHHNSYEYHSAFTQYQTMANILESL